MQYNKHWHGGEKAGKPWQAEEAMPAPKVASRRSGALWGTAEHSDLLSSASSSPHVLLYSPWSFTCYVSSPLLILSGSGVQ